VKVIVLQKYIIIRSLTKIGQKIAKTDGAMTAQ
jgi:hypothetical protein